MAASERVEIVGYEERYRADFERLNREWIEAFFRMEEADRTLFADPFAAVVQPGGQIFFLLVDGRVRGTCAVVPHGPHEFELAKMAVEPAARGKGYGDRLIQTAITFAREAGARHLGLVTNSRLVPALRLYEKHGFRRVPLTEDDRWERGDTRMHLDLAPAAPDRRSGGGI